MEPLLFYSITGVLAGLLAGLLGVGGGLVIVPALAFYFAYAGIGGEYLMHLSIGTSLATIVVTAMSSAWAHHRRGAVEWRIVALLAPGIVLGALSGALLADRLASDTLRNLFGVFEIAVAVHLFAGANPGGHRKLPGSAGTGIAGWLIGTVSSLLGIGGGTLTVPFLLYNGTVVRNAVAVSAACGLPIAIAGSIGFALSGWRAAGLPHYSTGYIYWPAFAGIALTSVLAAPVGARLAHVLPGRLLRRIFAGFLVLVGIRLLTA